ncbi:MAG: hypothetical protein ACXQT4_06795, partial [Methanotrichaceae archaeon]
GDSPAKGGKSLRRCLMKKRIEEAGTGSPTPSGVWEDVTPSKGINGKTSKARNERMKGMVVAMKIIPIAVIASMLLVGMIAAEDPVNMSSLGKKPVIEPIMIKYTPHATGIGTVSAVDVRTLGNAFGTFATTQSREPLSLSGPTPITYTPSIAISMSNVTSSTVRVYTPFFSVGNITIATPPMMIFGGM